MGGPRPISQVKCYEYHSAIETITSCPAIVKWSDGTRFNPLYVVFSVLFNSKSRRDGSRKLIRIDVFKLDFVCPQPYTFFQLCYVVVQRPMLSKSLSLCLIWNEPLLHGLGWNIRQWHWQSNDHEALRNKLWRTSCTWRHRRVIDIATMYIEELGIKLCHDERAEG
jgi:hypothetical protein